MVIRTGPGQEFDAALRGDVLAFQADRIGIQARTGWSVLVIGHASVVHEIDRLVDLVAVEYRPGCPDVSAMSSRSPASGLGAAVATGGTIGGPVGRGGAVWHG